MIEVHTMSKNAFNEAYMDYPLEITSHTFNPSEWGSYLEKKMLDRIIIFIKDNHRRPTHFIMNPYDVYQLKRSSYHIQMNLRSFWQYKDMLVISSTDIVEGEIVCI